MTAIDVSYEIYLKKKKKKDKNLPFYPHDIDILCLGSLPTCFIIQNI